MGTCGLPTAYQQVVHTGDRIGRLTRKAAPAGVGTSDGVGIDG
jgi:hypothetical protein